MSVPFTTSAACLVVLCSFGCGVRQPTKVMQLAPNYATLRAQGPTLVLPLVGQDVGLAKRAAFRILLARSKPDGKYVFSPCLRSRGLRSNGSAMQCGTACQ